MTHDLGNKRKYPLFHRYLSSESINILSSVRVKPGDKVRLGRDVRGLGVNREFNGTPRRVKKGLFYYEFKLI